MAACLTGAGDEDARCCIRLCCRLAFRSVRPPLLPEPLVSGRGGLPTKNPARSGVSVERMPARSNRAATAITPEESGRTDAAARYDDDGRSGRDHDGAAIGHAAAIGTAMPAGSAAAGCIGCAETCQRARQYNRSEKILHLFLLHSFCIVPRQDRTASGKAGDSTGKYPLSREHSTPSIVPPAECVMNKAAFRRRARHRAPRKPSTSSSYFSGASRNTR